MTEFVEMRPIDRFIPLGGANAIIKIDKELIDVESKIVGLVEEIMECFDEDDIRLKVISNIMVCGLSIEVVQEVDNALALMHKFRLVAPGHNWHVEMCGGSAFTVKVDGIDYQMNTVFVNCIRHMMEG